MSKFKIGDRVRTEWGKEVATVVSIHASGTVFGVSYNGNSPQDIHEDWLTLVEEQKQPTPADVIVIMNDFTDEQRWEVIRQFCRYCGDKDPLCQCWNDE